MNSVRKLYYQSQRYLLPETLPSIHIKHLVLQNKAHRIVDRLQASLAKKFNPHRKKLLGEILYYVGETESALKCWQELLDTDAGQPLWIKYILGRPGYDIILLKKEKIAYCPIPKNASSSIKARINRIISGENKVQSHGYFNNVFVQSETGNVPDLSNYYSFMVVRDPIERLISYYNRNIVESGSLQKELDLAQLTDVIPTTPDLNEFVEKLETYKFLFDDVRHHVLPQAAYISTTISQVQHIYSMAETEEIYHQMSKRSGIKLTPTYLMKTENSNKFSVKDLNLTSLEILTKAYTDDYELLARWFSPPVIS